MNLHEEPAGLLFKGPLAQLGCSTRRAVTIDLQGSLFAVTVPIFETVCFGQQTWCTGVVLVLRIV